MNRYCSDDDHQEAAANAKADVALGKNLLGHFHEVSQGIIEISDLIKEERRNSNHVAVRQGSLIEMILFANEIKFKIVALDNGNVPPANPKDMISDLEYCNIDFEHMRNLDFHLATLTYDIDNMKVALIALPVGEKKVIEGLSKLIEGLEKMRTAIQKARAY